MSSLHEWAEEVIAEHAEKKPFAPENGQPLRFQVGDEVVFKNEYGLEFNLKITGLYLPTCPSTRYAVGARYLVNSDSLWYPVKEHSLRLAPGFVREQPAAG